MHARALPSMPRHVPIWANFVVYGPILKISNSMCMSNGNLEFSSGDCSAWLSIAWHTYRAENNRLHPLDGMKEGHTIAPEQAFIISSSSKCSLRTFL